MIGVALWSVFWRVLSVLLQLRAARDQCGRRAVNEPEGRDEVRGRDLHPVRVRISVKITPARRAWPCTWMYSRLPCGPKRTSSRRRRASKAGSSLQPRSAAAWSSAPGFFSNNER